MNRNELESKWLYSNHYYDAKQADSVMDTLEERIKELEADKLRQENYCESLVNENERLNEIIISKYMVGAELVNKNKALRHNLEDCKSENEALKQRIKELEIERDSTLQDAREWKETNEQNYKAYTQYYKECDKLEYELRNKGRKNAELQATNDELRNRIKKLESSQSKWISVEDRLPEHFGWVIGCDGDSNVFPVWYEAETKCFTFNAIPCATTHWQPLPPKSED